MKFLVVLRNRDGEVLYTADVDRADSKAALDVAINQYNSYDNKNGGNVRARNRQLETNYTVYAEIEQVERDKR